MCQQILHSNKPVAFLIEILQQWRQITNHAFLSLRIGTDMRQEDKSIQSGGMVFLESQSLFQDRLTASVIFHIRCGIVCMCDKSRSKIEELKTHIRRPFRNRIIIPFIRRNKVSGNHRINGLFRHHPEIRQQVFPKGLLIDQQTIAFGPVAIQQMLIGMRTQIMAIMEDLLKLRGKRFVAI